MTGDWFKPTIEFKGTLRKVCLLAICATIFANIISAQTTDSEIETVIIENAEGSEIFAQGKNVIVRNKAKGVLVLGGDITIEGEISGDVATIGGSIYQSEGSYIGGDVVVFGGEFKGLTGKNSRGKESHTLMYEGYENELRDLMRDPKQFLAPEFSLSFFFQRALSVLFWFIISFAVTMIAPNAVSRSITRISIVPTKILLLGVLAILLLVTASLLGLEFLPSILGVVISLMSFIFVMMAYVFGRVGIQAGIGKWVMRQYYGGERGSESISLLCGTVILTLALSLPYIWVLILLLLFVASLGIVLSANRTNRWQKS